MKYFVQFNYYMGWEIDEDFGVKYPDGATLDECHDFVLLEIKQDEERYGGGFPDLYRIVSADGEVV